MRRLMETTSNTPCAVSTVSVDFIIIFVTRCELMLEMPCLCGIYKPGREDNILTIILIY